MNKKLVIILLFILIIFLYSKNSFAVDITDEECLRCHIMKNPLLPFEENKLIEFKEEYAAMDFGVADDMMCYSCHNGSVDDHRHITWFGQRHKTDLKPTPEIKIPQGFPLKEGKIYCGTCHSPHTLPNKTWLRALNINSSYCRECHRTKTGNTPTGNHPSETVTEKKQEKIIDAGGRYGVNEQGKDIIICQTCHVIHGSPPGERLLVARNEGEGIGNSALCEICHTNNPSKPERGTGIETHATNVRAKKAIIPLIWGNDTPVVVSYNGNIVCRTCHQPHRAKDQQYLLVEKNEIGQFCSKCHPREFGRGKGKDNIGTHPLGIKLSQGMEIEPQSRIKLFEGTITCNSCHTAHNAFNTGSDEGIEKEEMLGISELKKLEDTTLISDTTKIKKSALFDTTFQMDTTKLDTTQVKQIKKKQSLLVYSNKNNYICEKCHTNKVARTLKEAEAKGTHPVNITSSKVTIPKIILKKGGRFGKIRNKPVIICTTCHKVHGGEIGTPNLIITDADARICGYCHSNVNVGSISEAAIISTHPVNIKPKKLEIPEEIIKAGGKLGLKGEIICYTCHGVHKSREATKILVISNVESSDICVVCHPKQKVVDNTEHNLIIIAPKEENIKGDRIREAGVCGACHIAHGGKGAKVWAKNVPPIKPGEDPVGKLCLSCHQKGQVGEKKLVGGFSHPTNFDIERVSGETDLPLFLGEGVRVYDSFIMVDGKKVIDKSKRKGKVMCATCHDVHQWDPTDEKAGSRVDTEGDGRNSFLRKRNIKNFLCIECHKGETTILDTDHDLNISGRSEKNVQGKTVIEDGACSACHLMHNGTGPKIWSRKIPPEIEKEGIIAKLCKTCHIKGQMAEKKAITKYSHPTDRSIKLVDKTTRYPLYDSFGQRYFNKPLLEALKTGKDIEKYYNTSGLVTCGTCHDVHLWNYKNPDDRPKSNIEGTGLNSFLRGTKDNTSNFCKDCHEDKFKIEKTEHDMAVVEKDIVKKDIVNSQGKTIRDEGICSACHLIHNGNGLYMWARENIPDGDSVMTLICTGCHNRGQMGEKKSTGNHSHPCDSPITDWRVSPTLPLYIRGRKDPDGNIACSTCHNSHVWEPIIQDYGPGKNTDGTVLNSFLRIPNDRKSALCGNCHFENVLIVGTKHDLNLTAPKEKNVAGETVAESGPCGSCHLTHNALEVKLWSKVPGKIEGATEEKDLLTALCKSCHTKGGLAEKKEIIGYNHPINIKQIEAGLPTSLPLYDEMGKKKFDGKITCSTCHDPHRWTPGVDKGGPGKKTEGDGRDSFLRLDNRKVSALCVDCHQREGLVVNTDHDLSVTVPDEENVVKETVGVSGACSACHVMHNGNDIRRWAKPLGPGDDYITQLCHSCHSEGKCAESKIGVYTHSIGVKMQKGRTTTFPLYTKEGKKQKDTLITCVTCHYSHQWSPTQFEKNVLSKGLFSFENIKSKVIGNVGYPSGSFVYIDTIDSFKPEIGQQYVVFKKGKIIARCIVDKINPFSKTLEVFARVAEYDPNEKIEKGDYVVEKKKLSKGLEGNGRNSFLRKPNDESTSLCFDCHTEKETIVGTDHDFRVTAPKERNMIGETVFDGGLCSACHRSHQGASVYISAKQVAPNPKGIIYSPICYGCHFPGGAAENKRLDVHHKIITFPTDEEINEYIQKNGKMKESMRLQIPDKKYGLVLYNEDGELDQGDAFKKKVVTCSTCHNEHVWDPNNLEDKHPWDSATNFYAKAVEGTDKNSYLRSRNDKWQLCNICHLATVHLETEEMIRRLGRDIKTIDSAQKILEEKKKKDAELETKKKEKFEEEEKKEEMGKVAIIKSVNKDLDSPDYFLIMKLIGENALNKKSPGKFIIGIKENFEGSQWEEYRKEVQYRISMDTVAKNIYIKFQDKLGNYSELYSLELPPIVISIKPDEEKSKLPKLILGLNVRNAKSIKVGTDKYLEKDKWLPFESTYTYIFPDDSAFDKIYIQFKDDKENKTEITGMYTPEDLIKPRVRKYVYREPIKIMENFVISIVFSETLNPNINPKIKITNLDEGKSPQLPEVGTYISTNEENDTYMLEGIKLTKEMGGRWLISVESAEGVIRNVMEPVADKIIFFDTRDKTLDFYNSVKFKIKEGEKTQNPDITLLMEGKGAYQMMISENDPAFENCMWEPFVSEKKFLITPIVGEKTIYVKFRNDEKLVSDVFNESIAFMKTSKEVDVLSGSLIEDKTLTKDGSPYYIVGTVKVERGVTLTIEPGVKLLFSDFMRGDKVISKGNLIIRGNIIAKGTQTDNIFFTSKKENPEIGDWGMIRIDRNVTDKKNVFENCYITYAEYGIWVETDNPIITNSTFELIKNDAIHFERDCRGQINDNTIRNNGGSGIFLREASPDIYKNSIENNKDGIICINSALPKITDNFLSSNNTAISCENMAAPRIINAVVENNRIGIRIMSYSFPTVVNSNISENKEFGIFISESCPMIYKNIIQKNKIGVFVEKDYRDFKISLNNIMENTEYNLKITDYWRDLYASENFWGFQEKNEIKKKIYDKENYEKEPKEGEKKEDEMPIFDFLSTEDVMADKMKEDAGKSTQLEFIEKVFGVVRYSPFSLFKNNNAGVQ